MYISFCKCFIISMFAKSIICNYYVHFYSVLMANRRLLVSDQTGEKIRQFARQRGVTMGVFLDWLIRYIEENPIDQQAALENKYFPVVRKEMERNIAILRRIEKDYIIPRSLGVKILVQQSAEIYTRAEGEEDVSDKLREELEAARIKAGQVAELQSKVDILKERF